MEQTLLEVKRGDTKSYTLKFVDEVNSPIDISGWIVFFTVKESINDIDANAKIKKDISSHTNPTGGQTQIGLSSSDTNLEGNYVFDIQIKKSNGDIKTIVEGTISFSKDVTIRTS